MMRLQETDLKKIAGGEEEPVRLGREVDEQMGNVLNEKDLQQAAGGTDEAPSMEDVAMDLTKPLNEKTLGTEMVRLSPPDIEGWLLG